MSKAAAASHPPPPPEVAHLVDQLQRHHLAPDASLLSNSAHADLLQVRPNGRPPPSPPSPSTFHTNAAFAVPAILQAREEVSAERALYLEALVCHYRPLLGSAC
jgi:hypothetical protein